MIIGRYAIDPILVMGGGYSFDPETKCYHVVIDTPSEIHEQAVEKLEEARALLRLIDKAVADGAEARQAMMAKEDGGAE